MSPEPRLPTNGVLIYDGNGYRVGEQVCRGNGDAVLGVRRATGSAIERSLYVSRDRDGRNITLQIDRTDLTVSRGALVAVLKHILGEPMRHAD